MVQERWLSRVSRTSLLSLPQRERFRRKLLLGDQMKKEKAREEEEKYYKNLRDYLGKDKKRNFEDKKRPIKDPFLESTEDILDKPNSEEE